MNNDFLLDGERLDDLEIDNLMIIQKQSGYRFSTDSVLLANFIKAKTSDKYVDLCSGSGVVAILASYKNKLKSSFAVEVQPQLADMAIRSIAYNGLEIEVVCDDLKNATDIFGYEKIDIISVNPPYNTQGITSEENEIAIATHEIMTNLETIASVSGKILKYGGKFYMVHRADRLVDIFYQLRKNNLEPKVLRVVYPKRDKEPNLVLVEAKKGAKMGLKILEPLILMNDDGTETDELKRIYSRKFDANN